VKDYPGLSEPHLPKQSSFSFFNYHAGIIYLFLLSFHIIAKTITNTTVVASPDKKLHQYFRSD
jgi:hypothetical protein